MNKEYKYYVYKHTTPNNKIYIGITSEGKVENRWVNGCGYRGQYFYMAIQEFGWDNIEHKVLIHGLTKEQAERWESKLIKYYKSNNEKYGYNRTSGGGIGVVKHSQITKELVSKNNGRWYLGKSLPIETRKKISKSHNKNKKPVRCIETGIEYESCHDAGRKTGISIAHIVTVCKDKTERKIAGGYHWEYINQKHKDTPDYTQTKPHKIKCVETDTIYNSIMEASRQTNINRCCISDCLRGNQMTAGTFHWEYVN